MKKLMVSIAFFLAFALTGFSQKSEVFIFEGAAIRGYDPVAYFTDNKAVKGDDHFSFEWKNAVWHFANAENLAAFKSDPQKYAPQYGGYCAYGTAEGHKAPTSADAWTIVDNKLYFNYNKNVQSMWKKNTEGNIQKAEKNWPLIKDKE
jgi:hypothetical protein